MTRRPIFNLIALILIFIAPYWLYFPVLALGLILLPVYWEGVVLGFIIDVLYGADAHTGISLHFPFAIAASVAVLILYPLKKQLRINA